MSATYSPAQRRKLIESIFGIWVRSFFDKQRNDTFMAVIASHRERGYAIRRLRIDIRLCVDRLLNAREVTHLCGLQELLRRTCSSLLCQWHSRICGDKRHCKGSDEAIVRADVVQTHSKDSMQGNRTGSVRVN